MPTIKGTNVEVEFSRVVDGDTIRVFLPGQQNDESLRILALDTEESNAGGSKPVTLWGKEAKKRAQSFFEGADKVIIEFPGNDPLDICVDKYRGNFGRLLVYVYRDGVDFQETMIREGYSPYFMKYGNADFIEHHRRYQEAETDAQRKHIGVWDQLTVNGQEMRNYAALGTWWKLRARVIDDYRALKAQFDNLFNTRLDFELLKSMAEGGETATIFTELSTIRRVGGSHGLISNGSLDRPFDLFIPQVDSDTGQEIIHYLENRYISAGEDMPRRSYAYVTGELSMFRDNPQMVIESADQITDEMPAVGDSNSSSDAFLRIVSLLPNPAGVDGGHETITLGNTSSGEIDIQGWTLRDRANHELALGGSVPSQGRMEITIPPNGLSLNNSGDDIFLVDSSGELRHKVSYSAQDVVEGGEIKF